MKIGIYAIRDKKAEQIIGGLRLHPHPSTAVREFGDIGLDTKSMINRHPDDFELVQLGELTDDHTAIEPIYNVVITGTAWAAAQRQPEAP